VPALPVVNVAGTLVGVFGEREFIGALFPGYLTTLGYAASSHGRSTKRSKSARPVPANPSASI